MNKKKIWKKIILILTCGCLFTGATVSYIMRDVQKKSVENRGENPAGPSKGWHAFSPSDQRFKVHLPTDPVQTTEQMVIANQTIAFQSLRSETNDTHFAVSYLDFPGKWRFLGTNKLLTKVFELCLQSEQNVEQILEQEISNHKGYPALTYRFIQNGKEIEGKFLIVGNTLYRLAVTYPLAAIQKLPSHEFFNSFELKG